MKLQKQTNAFFIFLLIVCCLTAFWPLTLSLFSLKNDALNYFLPVRVQISEAIQNGYWPFWSPYFNLGYPLHGDMQSGVWNPFVQILSLFGVYTIKTLQYETLMYVFISGLGMYFLLCHFINEKIICLFGAVSYMLCAYNSDSAQFLNWISSASFIPFVFLFYYKTLNQNKLSNAIYCSLFLYLLFVTAYPADFILMAYLMLAMFLIHFIGIIRKRQSPSFTLKSHLYLSLLFIIISLPAIISYAEFLPLTERGSGTSFNEAMSNSLHPKLLFSFISPLGVWKAQGVDITDPLERNSFFGFIAFAFLLLALFIKNNNYLIRFSKVAFFLFLFFSFGIYGGIRVVAYHILPLMDTFRHPANAKIFTTFFAIILSANSLRQSYLTSINQRLYNTIIKILSFSFIFLLIWIFSDYVSIFQSNLLNLNIDNNITFKIKSFLSSLTFDDLLLFNIVLQLPFFLILILYFKRKISLNTLVIFSIINSTIHTMLFQPFTVIKKDSVNKIQAVIDRIKINGFPHPDLQSTLEENSKDGNLLFDDIGVSNLYNKKIGRVDYRITPSNLLNQNAFWYNDKWKDRLFTYPILYAIDTAISPYDSIAFTNEKVKLAVTDNISLLKEINGYNFPNAVYNSMFLEFSPNEWTLMIDSNQPTYFCLFQNYYPRWDLYINDVKTKPDKINISFMGFKLPEGSHHIILKYEATDLKITYLISQLVIISILIYAIYNHKYNKKRLRLEAQIEAAKDFK